MASDTIDQGFKSSSNADLILFVENVLACLPKHHFFMNNWPDYLKSWDAGRGELEEFKAAVHAANDDPSAKKTAERDAKRAAILATIDQWSCYVALRASIANDLSLIDGTGFKRRVRGYSRAVKSGALLAPTNVDVKHGAAPGMILVKCDKMGKGFTYEVQVTMGDPSDESAWPATGSHFPACHNMKMKGLQSASRHHIRVRVHDTEGDFGPWSPHTPIIVL